jgi:hypothetical protein
LTDLNTSAWALIVANIVPLIGVIGFGWDVFSLLLVFWWENVAIGVVNVLRILVAQGGGPSGAASRFVLAPFFVVHFGGFTLGHGLMLFAIFAGTTGLASPDPGDLIPLALEQVQARGLGWSVLALFVSHIVSFVTNTLVAGEYKQMQPIKQMGRPYGRIVVMHLTVLFGAILAQLTGSSVWALVILVGLKLAVDLRAHLAERRAAGSYS